MNLTGTAKSTMFTSQLLDHFQNPRNAGDLPDATSRVEVTNPVCGDVLQLAVKLDSRRIAQVRFLCRGCTTAIACASLLTEKMQNADVDSLNTINADHISTALGGLPPATYHAAQLAEDALESLLKKLEPNIP